jgi:hypothetical protein
MSDAASHLAADADAAMTARRREAKYLVTADQARSLARELDRRIASHRHRGDGANTLPSAHHYVTTIYFDTASRALFRAAHGNEQHLKLRAKEYYDLHPDLTEIATDPRQLVRYQPILWLEIKERDGAHTGKRRIGIPKHDLPAFFERGEVSPDMTKVEARDTLEGLAALCARCREPLRADCVVNYRRTAWQDDAIGLRVTIDTGLAFFAPPSDLFDRDFALVRPTLGVPVAVETRRVIEIKTHGEPPTWLAGLLDQPVAFSKFEAASSAVHG